MASAADTAVPPASAPAPRGGMGIGVLIAAVVLSSAGAGGAAYFVMGKSKAEPEHSEEGQDGEGKAAPALAPANYLGLDPAFVVNLESPNEPRYLQAEVQLMSRDPIALETAKVHVPLIRNSLLMLFGQQKPEDISSREGKEKLREVALAEVQKVLEAETGKPVVEAVYFTSFVMQ